MLRMAGPNQLDDGRGNTRGTVVPNGDGWRRSIQATRFVAAVWSPSYVIMTKCRFNEGFWLRWNPRKRAGRQDCG